MTRRILITVEYDGGPFYGWQRQIDGSTVQQVLEQATAALTGSDEAVLAESADLIYHWMVVLAARGLTPLQVVETLAARAGTSGLVEKAARQNDHDEDAD